MLDTQARHLKLAFKRQSHKNNACNKRVGIAFSSKINSNLHNEKEHFQVVVVMTMLMRMMMEGWFRSLMACRDHWKS